MASPFKARPGPDVEVAQAGAQMEPGAHVEEVLECHLVRRLLEIVEDVVTLPVVDLQLEAAPVPTSGGVPCIPEGEPCVLGSAEACERRRLLPPPQEAL